LIAPTPKPATHVKKVLCSAPSESYNHPGPFNCQTEYFLSVSHKIGGIHTQLAKKTKTKVSSTESSEKLFLAYPHPTCQKNKNPSGSTELPEKYIWCIPTQLAKKTKTKVGSTELSEKLFIVHTHPTCQKNKNPSRFHRIIRKTIFGTSSPNLPFSSPSCC